MQQPCAWCSNPPVSPSPSSVSGGSGPKYFWLTPRAPSLPSFRSHFSISWWKSHRLQLQQGSYHLYELQMCGGFSVNKFWTVNGSGMWCCGFQRQQSLLCFCLFWQSTFIAQCFQGVKNRWECKYTKRRRHDAASETPNPSSEFFGFTLCLI